MKNPRNRRQTVAKAVKWVAPLSALFRGPRSASGATAVDFAFAGSALLILLLGTIEFGRLLFTQGALNYAAEEATRYAIVNYDESTESVRAVAEGKFILINPGRITSFNVTAPIDEDDQTKLVTVEINYQFEFLVPLIGKTPIQMSAASRGFLAEQ